MLAMSSTTSPTTPCNLNPRVLNEIASYDVARTIHSSLPLAAREPTMELPRTVPTLSRLFPAIRECRILLATSYSYDAI